MTELQIVSTDIAERSTDLMRRVSRVLETQSALQDHATQTEHGAEEILVGMNELKQAMVEVNNSNGWLNDHYQSMPELVGAFTTSEGSRSAEKVDSV